jgi:hypothetical protein
VLIPVGCCYLDLFQGESLTFNGQTGQRYPIKHKSFSSEKEKVLQLALKLNSALATAETWLLKPWMLKVKLQ